MRPKQVDKDHYGFAKYVSKERWASIWHQLDEVLAFEPRSILEIGPGPGIFKALAGLFGTSVETLDIDPDLEPDHLAPVDAMPFEDNAYDVVCAFQMLEHVPYEEALAVFREMARVAQKGVVISLPDAAKCWPMAAHVPRKGLKWFHVPRPRLRAARHEFNGEHYWEINKAGYARSRIQADLANARSVKLLRTWRVNEHPYHRFFVFQKRS